SPAGQTCLVNCPPEESFVRFPGGDGKTAPTVSCLDEVPDRICRTASAVPPARAERLLHRQSPSRSRRRSARETTALSGAVVLPVRTRHPAPSAGRHWPGEVKLPRPGVSRFPETKGLLPPVRPR